MRKGMLVLSAALIVLGLGVGIAYATIPDSGGVIHGCYAKSGGTLRVVDAASGCKSNETSLDWSQTGPSGGSHLVYGGSVDSTGTPMESGFTVKHTNGTGLYELDFPAGTFSGSAGKFVIATITPIGNSYVDSAGPGGLIAADGSTTYNVGFFGGDSPFDFVVAVAIG